MKAFFAIIIFIVLLTAQPLMAGPKTGGTLIWGRGGDSVALDPAATDDGESSKMDENIFWDWFVSGMIPPR